MATIDSEAKRAIGVAFEMTRVALGLSDRGSLPDEIIAKLIMEVAKAGERNPDLLCERVLNKFRDRKEFLPVECVDASLSDGTTAAK